MVLVYSGGQPVKMVIRAVMALHTFLYRLTGGAIGGQFGGFNVLLLTTVGRKSGKSRTIPLGYFVIDGDTVLVASNGGSDSNPSWYFNLKSNPQITVEKGREKLSMRAELVDSASQPALWAEVVRQGPSYGRYATSTTRPIPLFRLKPA